MQQNLRRARGTLSEDAFDRAAAQFKRMTIESKALAKAYLMAPGLLQVDIAAANNVSRQLVFKQCKKIYEAHCAIERAGTL